MAASSNNNIFWQNWEFRYHISCSDVLERIMDELLSLRNTDGSLNIVDKFKTASTLPY